MTVVYNWIESRRLLGWRLTRQGTLIPAEQIQGPGEVVPGIDRVLEILPEPRAAWRHQKFSQKQCNATHSRHRLGARDGPRRWLATGGASGTDPGDIPAVRAVKLECKPLFLLTICVWVPVPQRWLID